MPEPTKSSELADAMRRFWAYCWRRWRATTLCVLSTMVGGIAAAILAATGYGHLSALAFIAAMIAGVAVLLRVELFD